MADGWTLAELTERVAEALAADAVRAPNGRVRDLPDARAIRWYATIGLVDRPLQAPGRLARYGPRHLLQLVALKRRQAQGRTLAQIQAELAGATDDKLRGIARIPDDVMLLPAPVRARPATPADQPDSARAGAPAGSAPGSAAEAAPAPALEPAGRARFWAGGGVPAEPPGLEVEPELGLFPLRRKAPVEAVGTVPVSVRYQIGLPGGATLGLGVAPTPDDLAAVAAAAAPLLHLLAARGLLTDDPESYEGDAR